MKTFHKRILAISVAAALAAPGAVFATNGYFAHGYGTKNKGLVGAGAALPQDSMIAATNPAGMAYVGKRLDVGIEAFSPMRKYTSTGGPTNQCAPTGCTFSIGPQSIESDNELFLIPHFGFNWMLNDDNAIGVSVYGNGGMNTEYPGGTASVPVNPATNTFMTMPGTYGDGTAGVDLAQLFVAATYAVKFADDKVSFGVSPILAAQQFEAKGLGNFAGFSTDAANLSNNGKDTSYGYGLKLGIQGDVGANITLAASYQSKMEMEEFDKYKGLFAEQGDFDIPSTWTLGLAWKATENSALVFDVQRINYTDVKAVSNPIAPLTTQCMPGMTGGTGAGCLGGDNGAGFGWQDMTIYKIGYQFATSQAWTWRVGFSTGDQPVPNSEVTFNILAPGIMEQHFTFGFTWDSGKSSEVNFAAMYAPSNTVSGTNTFDPAQNIEIEMSQYDLEVSWGYRF